MTIANVARSELPTPRPRTSNIWGPSRGNTKASMDQDYKTYYVQTQQEILSMIRNFCSEFNKDKKYTIIISNEPGLVFYKDSTMDITKDLLEGLNKMYGKKKAEKNK